MASRNPGDGRLRGIIEAACEAEGVAQKTLTVLAVQHDPYRLDTDTHHRNGRWVAEQLSRFYGPTKQTHWRGLHYSIVMAKTKILKTDGQVYRNTDEDWIWLSDRAGKAARWLGYVAFDRIIDRRNSEPVIHRAEKVEPRAAIVSDIDSVEFPDDIEPAPAALGFVARQAFAFVLRREGLARRDLPTMGNRARGRPVSGCGRDIRHAALSDRARCDR